MNREIKFRAFTKRWGIVYPDNHDYEIYVHAQAVWKGGCDEEGVELMQFTGLFDKNKKEIYEGDILNWESNSMSHRLGECKRTRIVEVKWDQEKAAFITCEVGHKRMIPTWKMDANDFNGKPFIKEVIGNIFENSELLA